MVNLFVLVLLRLATMNMLFERVPLMASLESSSHFVHNTYTDSVYGHNINVTLSIRQAQLLGRTLCLLLLFNCIYPRGQAFYAAAPLPRHHQPLGTQKKGKKAVSYV